MAWVDELSDPQELRRCIRDLIALSALPAVWKSYKPHQIADSVAAALISTLDLEFVYVSLEGRRDEPVIEVARTGNGTTPDSSAAIRSALLEWLPRRSLEPSTVIANPVGEGNVRIAYAPIGLANDALRLAASGRTDFPTESQQILLTMGANQAAIAVQRWHAETEERRFFELVENSSDFIGFASLGGVRQYINPAGLKLVGIDSLEEARGMHVLDFVTQEERARVRDELWPIVMRDGRWVGEITFRHFRTGAVLPFLVDWFRIDDPRTGQPMNIATVSRDLTAQKQAEAELRHLNETLEHRVAKRTAELAEANQKLVTEILERERADAHSRELQLELFLAARLSAAGQMAGALAHELNQPLAAVTNSVNAVRRLLARGELLTIDAVQEVMDEAAGEVLRAGQIIRRLRDFVTRGETEKKAESVVTMVEEASALALTGAAALGVEVRFRLDPSATRALADRIQVQQVLVNLIHNALEAMAGRKRRRLDLATALLDKETIEIAIADSGPGISKSVTDRVFEPFVSTKRNGMGLGLSICRSIVEAHGGRLRAEPNSGGGATFRFTLAAVPNHEKNHAT